MKKLLYLIIIIIAISVISFFGIKTYKKMAAANIPIEINGSYFDSPRLISPFSLKKASGLNFDDTDLMNNWTLIFFGYTRCPDICPATLKILDNLYSNLEKDKKINKQDLPEIVFISVDTDRDDFEQLKDFTARFNKNFSGITGEKNQIVTLAKNLGVIYNKLSVGENQENYLFDHSSTIYVINPRGELQAIFTAPHKADELAPQYKKIVNRYKLLS
tara:strand:- start:8613 stop:9263 length:651 start_codon:yes stop_codon:yes gene_type:complete